MADVFTKSPTCNCESDGKYGSGMKLVLVEGNTTIWGCPHVDCYIKERTTQWVLKE